MGSTLDVETYGIVTYMSNDVYYNDHQTISAFELSIIPVVLASSCCLTIPGLSLLGISFLDGITDLSDTVLRIIGFIVMVLSLVVFLYLKGIRSRQMLRIHKRSIVILVVQTALFSVLLYVIALYIIVPVLCDATGVTICTS